MVIVSAIAPYVRYHLPLTIYHFTFSKPPDTTVLGRFADEAGRTLKDLLARYAPEAVKVLDR